MHRRLYAARQAHWPWRLTLPAQALAADEPKTDPTKNSCSSPGSRSRSRPDRPVDHEGRHLPVSSTAIMFVGTLLVVRGACGCSRSGCRCSSRWSTTSARPRSRGPRCPTRSSRRGSRTWPRCSLHLGHNLISYSRCRSTPSTKWGGLPGVHALRRHRQPLGHPGADARRRSSPRTTSESRERRAHLLRALGARRPRPAQTFLTIARDPLAAPAARLAERPALRQHARRPPAGPDVRRADHHHRQRLRRLPRHARSACSSTASSSCSWPTCRRSSSPFCPASTSVPRPSRITDPGGDSIHGTRR